MTGIPRIGKQEPRYIFFLNPNVDFRVGLSVRANLKKMIDPSHAEAHTDEGKISRIVWFPARPRASTHDSRDRASN